MNSSKIVSTFFQFQMELKLYHWRTFQYARHKSTDHLFERISGSIDRFVETYMGNFGKRVDCSPSIQIRVFSDKNADKLLKEFCVFLVSLTPTFEKQTDLLTIRDELLADCRQTQYLFTLQ